MIEINLLPEEMRKKESPLAKIDFSALNLQKLPVIPIAIGIVAAFIGFQIILFVVGAYATSSLASLAKRYDAVMPKKREVDQLKAQVDAINKKMGAINELMARRFSWVKKLNALSDSMTQGIWLSELTYDERYGERASAAKGRQAGKPGRPTVSGALVMIGYTSSMGEQGASLVGKFIKSLRENQDFFSDFSDIQLVSIKSDKFENQEVMTFRISCFFK